MKEMKKIVSVALALLLLVGTMLALVSCGGDIANGTYKAGALEIEIKGNKWIFEEEGNKITYKYSVEDDVISFEYESFTTDEELTDEQRAAFDGAFATEAALKGGKFEKTDDGFKIGFVTYTKQ